jgi:hypothetical protein
MPSQSTLLGAAGEHYVLCQLLRRGYIAALAPIGVPNADILVTVIARREKELDCTTLNRNLIELRRKVIE